MVLWAWRTTLAVALLAGVVSGCGDDARPPVPSSCTESVTAVEAALAQAPPALPDGAPLSRCVSDADTDAELQDVGVTFHRAAERLAVRARAGDAVAAAQLGYLIGATRKGAERTAGVMAELVRRIESVGGAVIADAPAQRAAIDAGIDKGFAQG